MERKLHTFYYMLSPTRRSPSLLVLTSSLALLSVAACGSETVDRYSGTADDPDAGSSVPPANAGDPSQADGTCEQIRFDATSSAPQVMIALDQSSSMRIDGRWGAAVQAVSSVVSTLESDVAFGLAAFGTNSLTCGATRMVSAPTVGNAETIIGYMRRESPRGGTPIAGVLESIANFKRSGANLGANDNNEDRKVDESNGDASQSLQGVSSVILVTDGAPNCNGRLDPNSCICTHPDSDACAEAQRLGTGTLCLDDDGATAAVQALRDLGVDTYVIGYSVSEWADTLDRMASAGSDQGQYIPVGNALELEQSLTGVAMGLGTCSFELQQEPASLTRVRVALNGAELPHSSQANNGGWALNGTTINLLGGDCERVRGDASAVLDITVECEDVFNLR